jgi:hypothetical protein
MPCIFTDFVQTSPTWGLRITAGSNPILRQIAILRCRPHYRSRAATGIPSVSWRPPSSVQHKVLVLAHCHQYFSSQILSSSLPNKQVPPMLHPQASTHISCNTALGHHTCQGSPGLPEFCLCPRRCNRRTFSPASLLCLLLSLAAGTTSHSAQVGTDRLNTRDQRASNARRRPYLIEGFSVASNLHSTPAWPGL